VLSTIQAVPGVAYVNIETFDHIGETSIADDLNRLVANPSRAERIRAHLARPGLGAGKILPAQLAYLNPDINDTLILKEIVSVRAQ
jgi:hypothetical protein